MDKINYYLGRFGYESFLFTDESPDVCPTKGEFIFFNDTSYKVIYIMMDYDHNKYNVFVRQAIEEDF